MNKLITTHNGGFPHNLNDLRFISEANNEMFMALLSHLDLTANNRIILSGIKNDNSGTFPEITAGYIYIDGEIYYFQKQRIPTSPYQLSVLDVTVSSTFDSDGSKVFQDGTTYDTYNIRRAVLTYANLAIYSIGYQGLSGIPRYEDLIDVVRPGMVVLWEGNTTNIPIGYKLCDGSNGTTNYQGPLPYIVKV